MGLREFYIEELFLFLSISYHLKKRDLLVFVRRYYLLAKLESFLNS
jgi:hypothetical protein